nr:primase C-terminal domain-containing protein [Avibacterium paragallinarum]
MKRDNDKIIEGRNCYLFDEIKSIGYREVLHFKKSGKHFNDFHRYLMSELMILNQKLDSPLNDSELKGIAKSSSNWIWSKFTPEKFSEIQSKRSKSRWAEQQKVKSEFISQFDLVKPNKSLTQLAKEFNVSLSTINRWLKETNYYKSKVKIDKKNQGETILKLRSQKIKWQDIAKQLNLTVGNAKMLFKRYCDSLN